MKLTIATFAALAGLANSEITYNFKEGLVSSVTQSTESASPNMAAAQLSTAIAAPGSKDLIMMLSSEISLITQTTVRDTNKLRGLAAGGKSTATAEAGVTVRMKYCKKDECPDGGKAASICAAADGGNVYEGLPKGGITFSSRKQELSVEVDLDCTCEVPDTTCDCEVTGYVEVGLELTTTAAHTFNFIADLANTGTGSSNTPIVPVACFELSAEASTLLDGQDTSEGSAKGYVGLKSTMLIVQEASVSNLL